MGMTKMVMMMTRAAVPKIMGKTPAFFTSNMSVSVPRVMKPHEKPAQPCQTMLPRMIASSARMSSVARPVRPLKKKEPTSSWRRRKWCSALVVMSVGERGSNQ